MAAIALKPLDQTAHSEDALDLATRAADYVVLEMGHLPNTNYIDAFFTAVPPEIAAENLRTFGIMEGPAMVGMMALVEGYEFHDDWWIGLLLLDPAFRGQGIGHRVVTQIKAEAKSRDVAMIKLAVLDANPRALKFWQREGFVFHRAAPALPGSDGHDRTVLKFIHRTPPDRPF